MSKYAEFVALARKASGCTHCFDNFDLEHSVIELPQPRWVGPKYWNAPKKILVVLLNPGSGSSRMDDADKSMRNKLHAFKNLEDATLDELFDHQRADMKNWGQGRFWHYYMDGLSLDLDEIAFANIAWCATKGNKYPPPMLSACFHRYTSELMKILSPDVVLLSGSNLRPYRRAMENILPHGKYVEMMHYAHREGRLAEENELLRVKTEISEV